MFSFEKLEAPGGMSPLRAVPLDERLREITLNAGRSPLPATI
jgi:hypothetical protein